MMHKLAQSLEILSSGGLIIDSIDLRNAYQST